jgi:2-polyprenyl-3-methyl-5-hydroxy-6-metoxy-1,4-benzoquinol methylase
MTGPVYDLVYDPDTDFDATYTRATARAIAPHLRATDRLLELGCATGLMTSLLAPSVASVVGVDHSELYLERATGRGIANASFHVGDLDGYEDDRRYDHVLATNVLHEVADPVACLTRFGGLLGYHGRLWISLQNPQSLHRLVALELGLIDDLCEIAERGTRFGTRALWTADEVVDMGAAAGLVCTAREGVLLKPLPNAGMAALDESLVEGYVRAAHHLPEHCSMNLFCFRRNELGVG